MKRKTVLLWIAGVMAGLLVITAFLFKISPFPGAMVIRAVFTMNGSKSHKRLLPFEPSAAVTAVTNQQYQTGNKDALLDVYYPKSIEGTKQQLPVIIWTHGGAWLAGNKRDAAPYYQLLAARGYVVVAPNYSLAPGSRYPKPVHELNDAHAYVLANAQKFYADTSKIILAGDSAGAQLSSQMAALITNSAYANEVGIQPALLPQQLKGVVLNCGIYQMEGLTQPNPTLPKIVGWGEDVSVWAYAGTKDGNDPIIKQMSAYYHVTKDFPPTYISGGNADPLTKVQSMPFASKLESLGVPVTALFYADDHKPALPHEYQFNLTNQDGQNALEATVNFIADRTR